MVLDSMLFLAKDMELDDVSTLFQGVVLLQGARLKHSILCLLASPTNARVLCLDSL